MHVHHKNALKRGVLAVAVAAGLSSCDFMPMPVAEYRYTTEGPTSDLYEDFEDNDGKVSNRYYWEGMGDNGVFKLSNSDGNFYIEPCSSESAAATKVVVDLPARGMLLFDWRFYSYAGGPGFQVNVNGVTHDATGFYGSLWNSLFDGFFNDCVPLNAGRNAIAFKTAQDSRAICQIDNVRIVSPMALVNENFESGDASQSLLYHMDKTDVTVVSTKSHTGTHSLRIKENAEGYQHRVFLIVDSPIMRTMRFWYVCDPGFHIYTGVDGKMLYDNSNETWQERILIIPAGMHAIWFWTPNNGSIYIDDISFN